MVPRVEGKFFLLIYPIFAECSHVAKYAFFLLGRTNFSPKVPFPGDDSRVILALGMACKEGRRGGQRMWAFLRPWDL